MCFSVSILQNTYILFLFLWSIYGILMYNFIFLLYAFSSE